MSIFCKIIATTLLAGTAMSATAYIQDPGPLIPQV